MANFAVVYDACLFYPAPLRDLMVRLAQTRRFRARWTERIHREWTEALLRARPELDRQRLERTVCLIDQAVPDCLVASYEHLIDELDLPDPDDRHVLAAAIRSVRCTKLPAITRQGLDRRSGRRGQEVEALAGRRRVSAPRVRLKPRPPV